MTVLKPVRAEQVRRPERSKPREPNYSVVTKAVDAETETKTEAAGFETEAKTETVVSETEAKTEAVYLKTEAEAQGSWPILLTVLSSGAVLAQKF